MTATIANNIKLVKNGLTVTIDTTSTEENLTKKISMITPGKSTDEQETDPDAADYGPNDTLLIDILSKAEQRITFNGYLSTDVGSGDSSNDAQGKKDDLKNIFLGGGTFQITFEGSTFAANSDKLSIKRLNTDGLTNLDSVAEFSIQMTVIKGADFA